MGKRMYALWGKEKQEYRMSEALLAYIRNKVGLEEDKIVWNGYTEIEDLPVSSELKEILLTCISPNNMTFDPLVRLKHSVGRSGFDYIALMENQKIETVDAVIFPTEEEIRCLLRKGDNRLELIPYGGGTSVTGGISSSKLRKFSVSIDLKKLDYIEVDKFNNIVEAGAGLMGPQIEEELNRNGLTLGNFPESFHYSTLGGWIATNAAGQESNRYGKIKEMVKGLRMESPTGTYQDRLVPGESAFFRLSDIVVGSEGAFGIVTRAWLRVQRMPKKLLYRAYMFDSFEEGLDALRRKFTIGQIPIISRLSDEDETELSMMGVENKPLNNLFKKYVDFRMRSRKGSLLIVISDRKEEVNIDGGINLGPIPAKFWERERYSRPLMYNELLKRGIIADTIETSAEWGKLSEIHTSSRKVFEEIMETKNASGIILCHSSHQYTTGSAIYFTFLFYSEGNRAEFLNQIREGLMENIISEGGSISHHHGIGNIQSKFLKEYKGNIYNLTKAVKSYFDPNYTLVPGILQPK